MSLQGTPSGLDGTQDPALVRNILRTLLKAQCASLRFTALPVIEPRIRMVAFEDCPTRFLDALQLRSCSHVVKASCMEPSSNREYTITNLESRRSTKALWSLSTHRRS